MADARSHDLSDATTPDQGSEEQKVIAIVKPPLPPEKVQKEKGWEREIVENALLLLFYR